MTEVKINEEDEDAYLPPIKKAARFVDVTE